MNNSKRIVTIALLIAIEIVLTRILRIQLPDIRIGFGFIPITIMAILYGPLYAGIGAAISDFLGAILFPAGAYFPGFTISAFLIGTVYGFFLHKQPIKIWRVHAAVIITTLGINLVLDTYFLTILYKEFEIYSLISIRIIRTMIMYTIQIICLRYLISGRFDRMLKFTTRTY